MAFDPKAFFSSPEYKQAQEAGLRRQFSKLAAAKAREKRLPGQKHKLGATYGERREAGVAGARTRREGERRRELEAAAAGKEPKSVQTGAKGGRFYISSTGSKVYVK